MRERSQQRNSEKVVHPSDYEVSKYQTHGVITFRLSVDGLPSLFVVYASRLEDARYAWLKKFGQDSFSLVVSSGKQEPPKKHKPNGFVDLTLVGQAVEGLVVRLHYNVSPRRQIPYDAKLEFLHRRN